MNTEQKIGKFLVDMKDVLKNDVTVALVETRGEGLHDLSNEKIEKLSRHLGANLDVKFDIILTNVIRCLKT